MMRSCVFIGVLCVGLAVSGVAIFDDLSIDQLGSGYTLVASGPGINATSAPFNITLLP